MSYDFCRRERRSGGNSWFNDFLNQNTLFSVNGAGTGGGTNFPSRRRPGLDIHESASQYSFNRQSQNETLFIANSSDVLVITAQIQAAVSVQVAIQLAIALVLSIVIFDEPQSKAIYEELMQLTSTTQSMRQQTGIVDSHDVLVINVDLEASVQIQILLQILLALVVEFELF